MAGPGRDEHLGEVVAFPPLALEVVAFQALAFLVEAHVPMLIGYGLKHRVVVLGLLLEKTPLLRPLRVRLWTHKDRNFETLL